MGALDKVRGRVAARQAADSIDPLVQYELDVADAAGQTVAAPDPRSPAPSTAPPPAP